MEYVVKKVRTERDFFKRKLGNYLGWARKRRFYLNLIAGILMAFGVGIILELPTQWPGGVMVTASCILYCIGFKDANMGK